MAGHGRFVKNLAEETRPAGGNAFSPRIISDVIFENAPTVGVTCDFIGAGDTFETFTNKVLTVPAGELFQPFFISLIYAEDDMLKVGDKAPDFAAKDENGNTVK